MTDPSTARLVLIGFLVAACANTPSVAPVASPMTVAPIASAGSPASAQPSSPAPNPVATASSVNGWPFIGAASEPVFGPDGTVYLQVGASDGAGQDDSEHSLVALDAAGRVRAGWPIHEREGSDFGPPAVGPDGSLYVEECGRAAVGCRVHRFSTDGQEPPGWPFEVPTTSSCALFDECGSTLIMGSPDTVYLKSWHPVHQTQVLAIDGTGRVTPGWPVALDGWDGRSSPPQIGSDGTLVIDVKSENDYGPSTLWALAPDGSPRPGWPIVLGDFGRFQLGPDGTVVTVSYEPLLDPSQGGICRDADRTVYSVVDSDGRTLPGWPRGSKGYASEPVVDSDGTIYYLSATGKVYAHDRAGDVKAGWPVDTGAFPQCAVKGPYRRSDGAVYILDTDVVAMSGHGTEWRYHPAVELGWPCSDSDCVGQPVAPAFGLEGVVYIALHHDDTVKIVALDHEGQPMHGWPYRFPRDPAEPPMPTLTVSPDGRLYVRLGTTIVALDPDGRISQ
jgi:outer membrane protein assembly factor BamB